MYVYIYIYTYGSGCRLDNSPKVLKNPRYESSILSCGSSPNLLSITPDIRQKLGTLAPGDLCSLQLLTPPHQCVYVCGHVYMYVYACVYVFVHLCVYTRVYVYVYAYLCIDCGSWYQCFSVWTESCMRMCFRVHTYAYAYVCRYIYICMFLQ